MPDFSGDFLAEKSSFFSDDSLPENQRAIDPENSAVNFSDQEFTEEMPAKKLGEFPAEKIDGKITLKPADFFRFELEIRKGKNGHYVTIKKALRFSQSRVCRQIVRLLCPDLTPKNLAMIRSGQISPRLYEKIISNTNEKGIPTYEQFIQNRPGRGRGYRLEQLDTRTRIQLIRFERLLSRSDKSKPTQDPTRRGEAILDN